MNERAKHLLRTRRDNRLRVIYRMYARDPAFERLRTEGQRPMCLGRGSLTPRVVMVGEAPGEAEATTRKPFQGPAGGVLDVLLTSIGLTRDDIWLTNVVKYRPVIGKIRVRNRKPTTVEQIASWPYIREEVNVFDSTPIVTLGSVALDALGPAGGPRISDVHGRSHWDSYAQRDVVTLYHPAVAIYEPSMMDTLLKDFRTVAEVIA